MLATVRRCRMVMTYGVGLLLAMLVAAVPARSDSYQVYDSFGKHFFRAPPERTVVTDWTLLEQLLALDVVPVGAPELQSYRRVMPFETLPESIGDIGLREKPDLDRVAALRPDLIIVGTDQKQLARPLSRIARVLFYQNFSPRFDNNGATALKRLRQLSEVFQQQITADRELDALRREREEGRARLQRGRSAAEPVTLVKQYRGTSLIRYSSHSLFGWVVTELGLKNRLDIEVNKFGELRSNELNSGDLFPGRVVCIGPCDLEARLSLKRDVTIGRVTDAWPYG